MRLTLETLQVIDAIDRKGSFAAAAAELDRVPSALTYLIRKLEDDLDVLLFDRSGHRAKLTQAGQELLREGRHLLRSADELERHVRRVATGWEVEIRIAIDSLICMPPLLELLCEFYREAPGTRVRLASEVLSGSWDALLAGRADLALGVPVDTPGGYGPATGFQSSPLGDVEMVFAVAPTHALANAVEPIPAETIRRHRAVAVGDTARSLPVITVGLLRGQDVLTVPDMQWKIRAQIAGLGCGYLVLRDACEHIEAGRLVAKLTAEPRQPTRLHYAWNRNARGRALEWFLIKLENTEIRRKLVPS